MTTASVNPQEGSTGLPTVQPLSTPSERLDSSISPRTRHTDLQPLSTTPGYSNDRRRLSAQSCISAISTLALPSPSIVAARAYYLERGAPIGPKIDAVQRRRSLIEGHLFARRNCTFVLATLGNLVV